MEYHRNIRIKSKPWSFLVFATALVDDNTCNDNNQCDHKQRGHHEQYNSAIHPCNANNRQISRLGYLRQV